MFEQLFGSKTRVKLMRLFLENPGKKFYVRELTRLTDSLINSIRRELANLVEVKLILEQEEATRKKKAKRFLNTKKYYYLNSKNLFQHDLLNLFLKDKLLVEKRFVERIRRLGDIFYLSLSGFFVEDEKAPTDILLIGDFSKERMLELFAELEKELGHELRYTVMDKNEFTLRRDIADSFLVKIMDNENNLIMINKINRNTKNAGEE